MTVNDDAALQSITRRHFFRQAGFGIGTIALSALFDRDGLARQSAPSLNPMAPKAPHFAPRAKNVIYLFMMGAPSQLDLFDEKPTLKKYHDQKVPEEVIKKFKLDTTFYKKHVDYKGFSILSSAKVSDEGLFEARYLIDKLLGEREDILKAMIKRGARFMVMAPTEMTTDVPEQRHMKNDPKTNWDKRARGLGGRITSCGEENLLNLRGDRYRNENILIHEFSHAIHSMGLRSVDRTFDKRLRATYARALEAGLWKDTYAATSAGEYWAEGAQAYFDCMRPQFGANTREKLQKYDPGLFALVDEVYKQSKFRYVRYDQRKKGDQQNRGWILPGRVNAESGQQLDHETRW